MFFEVNPNYTYTTFIVNRHNSLEKVMRDLVLFNVIFYPDFHGF